MTQALGRYNELEYEVEVDGKIIYEAGNSPFDSQVYTSADDGVGLETMRKYCEQTTKNIAEEQGAKFIGVEYLER